ncbi:hypothetical protein L6452_32349 [Arctium lappa]|uniref:Uncharacterized protein n=1 Tax=Arctium lappa TaxID=4217 RepID=A0ACB8Z4R3_ARCLA|nr:hypothetical protein L6452_32349 [Arctium lappa]
MYGRYQWLPNTPEGHVEVESTADQPPLATTSKGPPIPTILGGVPEQIPRTNIAASNAIMEEVTTKTIIRDSMMLAMNSSMAQQQEFFMKLQEDRDASHRQPETMAENIVMGSGGGSAVVVTEEQPKNGNRERTMRCTYKAFLGCNPKEFTGSDNPVACMYWLKEVEMAFESSDCDTSQWVKFASQLLRGEALIWWNLTRSALTPEVLGQLTWPIFKQKIMDKYYSERSLDKLEGKFRNLKKGTRSVANYSKIFLEKLNLVGHLVPDERSKIKAYQLGLPAEMRTSVRNARGSTLQEVIEESLLVEDDLIAGKEGKGQVGEKRKWEGPSRPVRPSKPFVSGRVDGNRREDRWCHKCKTKHSGPSNLRTYSGPIGCAKCGKKEHMTRECPIRGPVCFECRELGHMRKDCSKLVGGNRGNSVGSMPRAPSRVFRMTTEEAKETADIVSVVEVANGDQVIIRDCFRGYTLEIDGSSFNVDLLPMAIGGFDVVIGIDLLTRHKADIFCSKKMIQVPLSGSGVVTIYEEKGKRSNPIISSLKARKFLAKGYPSYQAYVVDAKKEKRSVEDVKTVQDYQDVFSEDLPWLPPERQVEFQIDLTLGAAPIAHAPYRLSPTEMQ